MAPTQNQISIFHISLDRKAIQIIPNTLFSLFSSSPLGFRPCLSFSPLVRSLYPLFLHAFHAFRPRFWVYLKFLGFSKIDVYFVKFLGWVLCFWCNMIMHCIQFAFSQCFMYLNVCLYAWKLCADSFGLGWTHDAIMFSTSNLYAFFMHTYPIFSLFLVLCCDGVFLFVSLSISLSLSLSLSDSLCMAPKHKSTLSRNPLHSGTSSSNPTPLHIQFRDKKAHKDFSENFSNHSIHLERHVVFFLFYLHKNISDLSFSFFIYKIDLNFFYI